MGFLDKLWDETLAGPTPETGLGKLRKYNSFPAGGAAARSAPPPDVPISRSITIVRAPCGLGTTGSASSSAPTTPKTPETPGGDFKKFTRRKSTAESAENRSPTIYDWVIMSSMDRC
ncbi:dormancy-associated protein homolog 4 isoform X2 [Cajanus cajan]|uniref:dormancy-associated protein homolog 4 isoform X2 n=1 Tax=Cajanus cajan TaxID=3821 RepID=UPI00098DB714|nr:dormancy-associated protein homolog 4 isoform X2 [Cajanus cajan]